MRHSVGIGRVMWWSLLCWALDAEVVSRLPITVYSVNEGLAQSVVYALCQDTRGYMWLGTQAGVSRFDGREFTNYNYDDGLAHNKVRGIIELRNSDMLFATERGISRFDGKTFSTLVDQNGVSPTSVRCLLEAKDGSLWGGSFEEGVFRYQDDTFVFFGPKDGFVTSRVRAILEDRSGRIWVGLYGGGVCYWEDGRWVFFDAFTQGPEMAELDADIRESQLFVRTLFEEPDGSILFGSNQGVYRIRDGVVSPFSADPSIRSNANSSIVRDAQGDTWLGTTRKGVIHYSDGHVEFLGIREGMSNNGIQSILRDNEDKLWFGTYGGGVCRLGRSNFFNYTAQPGFSYDNVYALWEHSNGTLWLGTNGGGLFRLANGEFTHFDKSNGMIGDKILCLAEDHDGGLWIGMLRGVNRYHQGRFTAFQKEDGLSHNTVYSIAVTQDGTIWFGTFDGMTSYADGQFRRFTVEDGLAHHRVQSFCESRDGTLWIGTAHGLTAFRNGRCGRSYHVEDGMVGDSINHMFEDDLNRLWIATSQGLVCYQDGRFSNFTTKDGLSGPICNVVLQDDRGCFWIGTNNGLNRFDGRRFAVFTYRDGLPSNEINKSAGIRDRNGNLWFGTTQGVTNFRSAEPQGKLPAPFININDIRVLGESRPLVSLERLRHFENYIQIEFTGISFSDSNNITYTYMLEGLDSNWIFSDAPVAVYAALDPGAYSFIVRAGNSDGVWSDPPARVDFTIVPPFWRTPWFVLASLCVLVAAVGMRFYGLKKRTRFLEQKVSERTTELEMINQKLEGMAHTDQLTGAMNRHFLNLMMPGETARLKRSHFDFVAGAREAPSLGFALMDLDLFKDVNDAYGHDIGDVVLQKITLFLKKFIREYDLIVRWGGEEFLLVIRDITFDRLRELSERIRRNLAEYKLGLDVDPDLKVTTSLGYCVFPLDRDPASFPWNRIVKLADLALYEAKSRGRNRSIGVQPTRELLDAILSGWDGRSENLNDTLHPCFME